MKALTLLLACSLWGTSAFSQDEAATQISQVKAEFAGKSLAEIHLMLAKMRPPAVTESDKRVLLSDMPLITEDNRVADRRQLDRLTARLQAALKLHDRAGITELIVFRDARPIIYNKPGCVVVFSTKILQITEDDDAALVGVVAHELAHEYVAMQMLTALKANDLPKIRKLELFCDALAVVTLVSLRLDPARYAKAVERICTYTQATTKLNDGTGSHPALATRLKLVGEMAALLLALGAAANTGTQSSLRALFRFTQVLPELEFVHFAGLVRTPTHYKHPSVSSSALPRTYDFPHNIADFDCAREIGLAAASCLNIRLQGAENPLRLTKYDFINFRRSPSEAIQTRCVQIATNTFAAALLQRTFFSQQALIGFAGRPVMQVDSI